MEYRILNNGVKMPMLGFGVYQTPPEDTERCIGEALDAGYRLIDTAQAYGNEAGVGAAIAKSGIPRDEVFVTSKIWVSNMNYERAAASIDEGLRALGTDHIDLMLLHQAMGDYPGAWRAMEDAYRAGKLRAIGVSNHIGVNYNIRRWLRPAMHLVVIRIHSDVTRAAGWARRVMHVDSA